MALRAATGTLQTGTGGVGTTVSVTGLAFQPQVVLFSWTGRTAVGQAEADHKFGMGYMVSATDRGGATTQSDHGKATMATNAMTYDNAAVALLTTAGGIDGLADFDAWLSDGFRIVIDDAFTASYLINYLALRGDNITNIASVTVTEPAVAGTQDINVGFPLDTGYDDKLVLIFGVSEVGMNTVDTNSNGTFGAVAGDVIAQAMIAGTSDDALATSATNAYCRAGECMGIVQGYTTAMGSRAHVSAWLPTGFRLVWDRVWGAGTVIYRALVLKGAQFRIGDTLSQTTTAPFSETDLDFGDAPVALVVGSHGKTQSTAGTAQADDERSVGFATGPAARNYVCVMDKNGSAAADVGIAQQTDAMYANQSNATTIVLEGLMDLTSLDPTGFTAVMADADPAQAFVWYVAMGTVRYDIIGFRIWYDDSSIVAWPPGDKATVWNAARSDGVQFVRVYLSRTYDIDKAGTTATEYYCADFHTTRGGYAGPNRVLRQDKQADYYWFDATTNEFGAGAVADVPPGLPAGGAKTGSLLTDEAFYAIYNTAREQRVAP